MRRRKTSQDSTIEYEAAKARVSFSPARPRQGLPEFQVRFHFPAGAVFDSFLHFHTEQSEYLFCEKGQIRVTVGQLVRLVGPEDGMITIDPWVAHRWETVGAEAIVWERSDPHPETKELFFR